VALMSLDPTGTGRQRWTNRWFESAWGAVLVLLPVRFPVPLAGPGVGIMTRRALHGFARQVGFAQGSDCAADMTWHYPA
jgi:hypothetical protein